VVRMEKSLWRWKVLSGDLIAEVCQRKAVLSSLWFQIESWIEARGRLRA
jgi:hypothetical protein